MQLKPDATPQLIDAATMGEILALPAASVRRLAREGTLASYKLGRLVRFDPHEVLETLRQQEKQT